MNRCLPLRITAPIIISFLLLGATVVSFYYFETLKKVSPPPPLAPQLVGRGENWETVRNPDGTLTQTIHAGQVNYLDEQGQYQEIDTKILAGQGPAATEYQNTTNSLESFYKAGLQSLTLNNVVRTRINGVELSSGFGDNELGVVNREAVAEVEDNRITYQEVYPGVDVRYTVLPGEVLEEYVIKSPPSVESLSQELAIEGGRLELQDDGGILIFANDGQPQGLIPPPRMYEEGNLEEVSDGIFYELEVAPGATTTPGSYRLVKILTAEGKKWLADPRRQYPVVIDAPVKYYDPTGKDGYLSVYCGTSYSNCPSSPRSPNTTATVIYVGQTRWVGDYYLYRGYPSFDTSSIPDNATIDQARLFLRLRNDSSATDFNIKFYSGDWGTLDSGDWTVGSTYEGVFRGTSGLAVNSWYNQTVLPASIDKYGETQFRLTSSREEAGTVPTGDEYVGFYSTNQSGASYDPYLEVTYTVPVANNPPNTPSGPSPASGATGQSVFSTLSWVGGDPDAGDTVTYDVYFEAGDSTPDVLVSDNQTATTYDPGALQFGTTYYWQIVADDNNGGVTTGPVWSFATVAAPSDYVVYSGVGDGVLNKTGSGVTCVAAYNNALAATATVNTAADEHPVGPGVVSPCPEPESFRLRRMYLTFDTSGLSGQTVQSASLTLTKSRFVPDETNTRFLAYTGSWGGSLESNDWGSGSTYQTYFNAPFNDVPGTTYTIPVRVGNINTAGATQFEVFLYDEAGTTGFYGADQETILGGAGRYRVFYSGDALGSLKPTLKVDTAAGCTPTAPNSPTLSSPTNGASGVSTAPTVSWNGISLWGTNCAGNNNTYEVFLDTNPSPATSRGSVAEGTTSLAISGLAQGTTYYWKVRASNGAQSTDSAVWSFTTVVPAFTPTVDSVTISTSPIVADGVTQYTITIKASDANGVSDLNDLRTIVNLAGDNAGSYRGYFRWGDSSLGGFVQTGSCSGGGFYGKFNGFGQGYVDLLSCSTTTSGNQRTVNFVFHANTNWLADGPLTNNDISGYTFDDGGLTDGWDNFDLNFGVTGPYLNVSPTILNFTATAGGSNPANQGVTVWNTGGGTLSWTAADDQTWLSESPISYAGNSTTLWAIVSISGLSVGSYSGTITVSCNPLASCQPGGQTRTVTVNLTISPAPVPAIARDPSSLTFPTITQGSSSAASQTFEVWNSGDAGSTLNWTASETASWFRISPSSGSSTGSGNRTTVTVTLENTSLLAAGTHSENIAISDANASNSPQTVSINLTVQSPPYLNADPLTLTFTPIVEGSSSTETRSILIWNTGDVVLNWTASESSAWFWLSPTSGDSTGPADADTVWVTLENTSSLAVGTHSETFSVSGQAGTQNSPQTVTVELTVDAAVGTISGYVFEENDTVCPIPSAPRTPVPAATVSISPEPCSGCATAATTNASGYYEFLAVDFDPVSGTVYQLTVSAPSGWTGLTCSCADANGADSAGGETSGSCAISVTLDSTNRNHRVDFGILNNPSGWLQVKNADAYAKTGIYISVPDSSEPPYPRWFIDADSDVSGGGVAVSGNNTLSANGRVSRRPNGDSSAPGWNTRNYGEIPWPSVLDAVSAGSGLLTYESGNITITTSPAGPNDRHPTDYNGKVVVVNGDITIDGSVASDPSLTTNRVNAVLAARGRIIVNDSVGNGMFKVRGALFAKDGFDFTARTLQNNKFPAIHVEYDPSYLLQTIPGLMTSGVSWKEVK